MFAQSDFGLGLNAGELVETRRSHFSNIVVQATRVNDVSVYRRQHIATATTTMVIWGITLVLLISTVNSDCVYLVTHNEIFWWITVQIVLTKKVQSWQQATTLGFFATNCQIILIAIFSVIEFEQSSWWQSCLWLIRYLIVMLGTSLVRRGGCFLQNCTSVLFFVLIATSIGVLVVVTWGCLMGLHRLGLFW